MAKIYCGIWILLMCILETLTDDDVKPKSLDVRLPNNIKAEHYKIILKAHLIGEFKVEGRVEAWLRVENATNQILLHMRDIITHNETLTVLDTTENNKSIIVQNQTYNAFPQFYIIHLQKELTAKHTYLVSLNYTGALSSDLLGFYKMSYKDSNGNTKYAAATQFQATNARRVFPCMDEPALKATFQVVLARETHNTALSNMPILRSTRGSDGWMYDEFMKTVPMSTYLLAFVIGDFKHVELTNPKLTTKLKVWARKEILHLTKYVSDITINSLLFLEEFYAVPFPLPKLDLVAVPEMNPNAMENWGLIISRESGLLHNPSRDSAQHARWVSYLTAHELAHQWFGNIVTNEWWTDLWLNEGFATYVGYQVMDKISPSWNIMHHFVSSILHNVMQLDSLKAAPPVRVEVNSPEQIKEVFGPIAYQKGGSIIRMMRNFLGKHDFQQGLKDYLNTLQYKSATQDDLWSFLTNAWCTSNNSLEQDYCLTKPGGVTVKEIMDTWTLQSGLPIVTFIRNVDGTTEVIQSQYILDDYDGDNGDDDNENVFDDNDDDQDNYDKHNDDNESWNNNIVNHDNTWWIPITYTTEAEANFEDERIKFWIPKGTHFTYQTGMPSSNKWVIANVRQTGYYRVNYDLNNWKLLSNQLNKNHTVIHPINRAQIIDDALNLARIGLLDYKMSLDILSYISKDKEYAPWMAALNNLAYIKNMLTHSPDYGAFKNFLLGLISPLFEDLGYQDKPDDNILTKFLRKSIVNWACDLNHKGCVKTAIKVVDEWKKSPKNSSVMPGSAASAFLCTAVREGDKELWNELWALKYSSSADVNAGVIRSLGCTNDVWLLARYLNASLSGDTGIQRQFAATVYAAVASNHIGWFIAWRHFETNMVAVKQYTGSGLFVFPQLIKAVMESYNTAYMVDEMKSFHAKYKGQFGAGTRAVKQAIGKAQANHKWTVNYVKFIINWLKENEYISELPL